MRLFEAERYNVSWQCYMADSLWILATGKHAAHKDGSPAYEAFSTLMRGDKQGRSPQRDTRTAEQIKADLLAKLDALAGD